MEPADYLSAVPANAAQLDVAATLRMASSFAMLVATMCGAGVVVYQEALQEILLGDLLDAYSIEGSSFKRPVTEIADLRE